MIRRADVAVYAPDERIQLVAEVKNRLGASPEWAAQMRRNLLVHSAIPNAPYFLLALPDVFYLWKDGKSVGDEAPPDYVVDAMKALGPYIDHQTVSLPDITESGLELLVSSWLKDLMNSNLSAEAISPDQQWLFDSGLYEAIKNGFVAVEATV